MHLTKTKRDDGRLTLVKDSRPYTSPVSPHPKVNNEKNYDEL
ncbi:hypothetical protein HMPREF1870_02213 [Bacteroidales bacterium KA00344]|nr:hypothetical protein HMPREF1870_02213 [Bacteroidales bacterium KA00344]